MAQTEQGAAGAEQTQVQFRLSKDHAEHEAGEVITLTPYLARKLERKKLGEPVQASAPAAPAPTASSTAAGTDPVAPAAPARTRK